MKRKIYLYPLFMLGVLLMFVYGCKKEKHDNIAIDVDGNNYKTVIIGTQTWMAENLKVTHYNDGSNIPNVTDSIEWSRLSTPAYCWYHNNYNIYGTVYGALYNWSAVHTGKLCPAGWHMPSKAEWDTLNTFLKPSACSKLKETGTTHWAEDDGATNETGFTALPAGIRQNTGAFDLMTGYTAWWTSTLYGWYNGGNYAWNSFIQYHSNDLQINWGGEIVRGYSVRCLKD